MLDKIENVNEDPWLWEGLRAQRVAKIQELYGTKIDPLRDQMKLAQSSFDNALDEIKFTAKETLNQFYKEREFEQEELERILARADDELATRSKVKAKEDRELTITEAQKLGVPIGTKLSEVRGKIVPTKAKEGTGTGPGGKPTFEEYVKQKTGRSLPEISKISGGQAVINLTREYNTKYLGIKYPKGTTSKTTTGGGRSF